MIKLKFSSPLNVAQKTKKITYMCKQMYTSTGN